MVVSEFISYSPIFDSDVSRLSMANNQGQEYYALIPFADSKTLRELRYKAALALQDAIERGAAPGQIGWHDD